MVGEAKPKHVKLYEGPDGNSPFAEWFEGLRDVVGRKRILARIRRLEQGNYGDCEPVGDGVSELRMFFGPGYRVYFGEENEDIIILLNGGDKDNQQRDIETAKVYWKEYQDHA